MLTKETRIIKGIKIYNHLENEDKKYQVKIYKGTEINEKCILIERKMIVLWGRKETRGTEIKWTSRSWIKNKMQSGV